MGSSGI
jgi:hypothetical protein